MKRRDFIVQSGTVVTAAAWIAAVTGYSADSTSHVKRPDPADVDSPILKAIAWGVNAPSPHNTQSWKFNLISDTAMLLYVDEQILLPATDPPSRQIHLGAGCFIETLALAATTMGYTAHIVLFPEGYTRSQDFGVKPVARISLEKSSAAANPLAAYITTRQTNRQNYKGPRITESEFTQLEKKAGASHAQLLFRNKSLEPFFKLFYEGLSVESRTFRTNEETRQLFRFSEHQMAEKGDGLSMAQMGYTGLMKTLVNWAADGGNPDKWHSARSIDAALKKIKTAIESAKGLVFWVSPTNTYEDWVKTGRDYVRFALALTSMNLYAHPYNQVIQEYDEMKPLRNQLNEMMHVQGDQKIQMIVRIGRASAPYYSYRKRLSQYNVGYQ